MQNLLRKITRLSIKETVIIVEMRLEDMKIMDMGLLKNTVKVRPSNMLPTLSIDIEQWMGNG